MKSVSSISQKKGYIMWIIDSVDPPSIDSIRPKLIHVGASIQLSAAQKLEFERLKNIQTPSIAINDLVDPVDIEIPHNEDDEEAPVGTEENLFERSKKSFQQRACCSGKESVGPHKFHAGRSNVRLYVLT